MMVVTKFDGRGKPLISLEGQSIAMLKIWALQNTTNKQVSIVYNEDTNETELVVVGNGKGNFPKIIKDKALMAAYQIIS